MLSFSLLIIFSCASKENISNNQRNKSDKKPSTLIKDSENAKSIVLKNSDIEFKEAETVGEDWGE